MARYDAAGGMEIALKKGGGGEVVLALDGELDLATAEPLRSTLLEAIANDGTGVALDMTRCSFIDSTGLRILVEAARLLGRDGQRLRLIGLRDQPLRVFELTMGGRLDLFQLADSG
jgi:anti-sigma B factor antagonist